MQTKCKHTQGLTDAIKLVLKKSDLPLASRDIAIIINDLCIYKNRDGNVVTSEQIDATVDSRKNDFTVLQDIISLK